MNLKDKLELLIRVMPQETVSITTLRPSSDLLYGDRIVFTYKTVGGFNDQISYKFKWRVFDSESQGMIGVEGTDDLLTTFEALEGDMSELEKSVDRMLGDATTWCDLALSTIIDKMGQKFVDDAKESFDMFAKQIVSAVEKLTEKPEETKPKLTVVKEEEDE